MYFKININKAVSNVLCNSTLLMPDLSSVE